MPHLPVSPFDSSLQLAVHTCFEPCRKPADCLIGFDVDHRPICTPENRNSGLYCVHPETTCEQYQEEGQICYDDNNRICINWLYILYAILITNCLQTIFEGAMLFALEITLKPSYLDKLQYPENNMEEESGDQQSSENKKEPDCGVVLSKCWGELLFIFLYVGVIMALCISLIY